MSRSEGCKGRRRKHSNTIRRAKPRKNSKKEPKASKPDKSGKTGTYKRKQRRVLKLRRRNDDIPGCEEVPDVAPPEEALEPHSEDEAGYLESLLNREGGGSSEPTSPSGPSEYQCQMRISPYSNAVSTSQSHQSNTTARRAYYNEHHQYSASLVFDDDGEQHQHQHIERRPSMLDNPHVKMLTSSLGGFCGQKARGAAEFLSHRPALMMIGIGILVLYLLMSLMEMSIVYLLDPILRFWWTHSHYILVLIGQGFRSAANWFYTADTVTDAWFCDLAETWCTRFGSLCDRRCSHLNRALGHLRPTEP
ncbi:unnamed protein product, partial [Mesorhabditis spiculigera]